MTTSTNKLSFRVDFRNIHIEFARKALLSLAGIVAGLAAILFLTAQGAAFGVGIVFVSAYCLYHAADKYQASKYFLNRAKQAIQ